MNESELHPEFFDLVGGVRAMRRLSAEPVPQDLIMKVLNAGVQAPSGQNLQPWKFLLVSDEEKKEWFRAHYADAITSRGGDPQRNTSRAFRGVFYQMEHMHEFPYLLFVCGKRDWPFRVKQEDRVGLAPPNYGAVYPAVQNILLACRAVGLGAALTTMHQVFEEELCEHFGIPEEYGVVVTIPIGWPLGNFGPVRRIPAEEKTFLNQWGESL